MKKITFVVASLLMLTAASAQKAKDSTLSRKDYKKDVLIQTTHGDMIIRLSDSTPLHRDNFLRLVKVGFYDSILFHRVIKEFMIQGGDPNSRRAVAGQPLGNGDIGYTVPAEFKPGLFHKKGALAAARTNNPEKASSSCQFYIVQGKVYTEEGLDSLETMRLNRKLPLEHRAIYKTLGGTPQLDQNYTVYGEVIKGLDVIDKIATTTTSKGTDKDRPVEDMRIIKAKLVKRKR